MLQVNLVKQRAPLVMVVVNVAQLGAKPGQIVSLGACLGWGPLLEDWQWRLVHEWEWLVNPLLVLAG